MKLCSIILALAACAVAVPLVPVSNQSSNITGANPNLIKALFTTVSNAANAAEEKAEAAEQILHSARLAVVSRKKLDTVHNAEHYANIAHKAASAAVDAAKLAAATAEEMDEIPRSILAKSSTDAVDRAFAIADRANQARNRAVHASEQTQELYLERERLAKEWEECLPYPILSVMFPFISISAAADLEEQRRTNPHRTYRKHDRYTASRNDDPIDPKIVFTVAIAGFAIIGFVGVGCFAFVGVAFRKRVAAVKAALKASETPKTISAPVA